MNSFLVLVRRERKVAVCYTSIDTYTKIAVPRSTIADTK